MKTYKKVFYELLKQKGLKLTQPRNAILEAVFHTHSHFNVDELYDILRKDKKEVSRPTVYRTIPLLLEAGLIKKSFTKNDKENYEHIYGHHEHIHFICLKCGAVIELENEELQKKLDELASNQNFKIKEKNVLVKGICSKCQRTGNK